MKSPKKNKLYRHAKALLSLSMTVYPTVAPYIAYASGPKQQIDPGVDGKVDIGDVVRYISQSPTTPSLDQIVAALQNIDPAAMHAPVANGSMDPSIIYNEGTGSFNVGSEVDLGTYFSDADHDISSYQLTVPPSTASGLQVAIVGTKLLLSGSPSQPTSFTITASDSSGLTAQFAFYLKIAPAVAASQILQWNPNTSVFEDAFPINLATIFPDSGSIANYSISGLPSGVSATIVQAVYGVSPTTANVMSNVYSASSVTTSVYMMYINGRPEAPASFTVTAARTDGTRLTVPFYINFVPVALPVSSALLWSPEDGAYVRSGILLPGLFHDADPVAYKIEGMSSGSSTLTPAISSSGVLSVSGKPTIPVTFQVSATDIYGGKSLALVPLHFAPTSASTAVPIVWVPSEHRFASYHDKVADYFIDPEQDIVSYSISKEPSASSGIRASITSQSLLQLTGPATSPTTFTVRAVDRDGGIGETAFTVNFAPAPLHPFSAVSLSNTTTILDLQPFFADYEGDYLQYRYDGIQSSEAVVSALVSGNLLMLSGSLATPAILQFSASDGHGMFIGNSVTLLPASSTVVQAPQVLPSGGMTYVTWSPKMNAFEGNDEHVSAYFSDADALTYSVVQQPQGFEANIVSGDVLHLSGTPVTPYTNLVVRATDPGGLYADLTYGLNYAPLGTSGVVVAYNPTGGAFAMPTVNVGSYFYDPEGDIASYTMIEAPGGEMSATLSGNVLLLSGTPTVGTTFKVRATDVHGAYDDATVAVDYMPQAVVRPAVTPTGIVTNVDLNEYFSDADGESLYFELGNTHPAPGVYASLSGHMLLLSGVATAPYVEPVYATDYRSGWVSASVSVQATAGIPQALPSGGLTYVTWSPKTSAFTDNDEHVSSYFSDADSLTYSVVQQPVGFATSIVSGDVLHLSGTPVTPYTNLVVRATDPGGLYADLTYGLNYAPLGTSGVVVAYNPTGGAFAMPTVNVGSYFYDPEGDIASYTMIEAPGGEMSATLSGNVLLLSGTPTVGTTFKVRATDVHGAYDDATVAVDYMPQAVVRPAVTPTGIVTNVDLNEYFSDADGESLYFELGNTHPAPGVYASLSGHMLLLSGVATAPYVEPVYATDYRSGWVSASVSVQATAGIPQALPSGGLTYVTWSPKTDAFVNNDEHVSSYFSDADSLTYSVVQQPYGFKASIVSGDVLHLSGTPVTPYTNLVVRATDPGGLYADLTYGLNYAPYGYSGVVAAYNPTSGAFAMPTVNVGSYFYDPEGDIASYTMIEAPGGEMSATLSGNVLLLSGTPTVGTTFKVRATDVRGAYDDATVAVDYMPQAVVRPAVTPTGIVTNVDLNEYFSDADGESLYFELGNTHPAPGVYASLSGHMLLLSGVATAPYVEPVYATDYRSGWVSASVSVQATAGIPQALPSGGLTYVTWSPKTSAFTDNDEHVSSYFSDADSLTYSVVQQPVGFATSIVSGDVLHLLGTPVTPYTSFKVRATDPGGLYADLTYELNYAPYGYSGVVAAYNPTSGAFAMPTVDVRGYFYDADGDVVSYAISEPPGGAISATLSGNVLLLSGTPTVGTTFKVRATDVRGAYDDATVAVDYMPQAVVRPAVTPTGIVTNVDLNEYFSDADGESLYFELGNTHPAPGVYASLSGHMLLLSGVATAPYVEPVYATDYRSGWVSASVSVQATAGIPQALPSGGLTYVTWSPKTDAFVNNDEHVSSYFSDTDALTYSVVQQPVGFATSIVSGDVLHLLGTPVTPYTNMVVRATDPGGLYADLTYELNYAPYGYSGVVAAYNPTSGAFAMPTVDVRGYFYDADGDVASYTMIEAPGGAISATLSGNVLLLSGTPTVGTTFKVRATDVRGAYDDATVAVDYMPQAVVRPAVTPTGIVTNVDLNEYFSDADGESLYFELGNTHPAPGVYASLSGHMLLLSGVATAPYVEPVYVVDRYGYRATATVSVQATAGIPQALPSGGLTYVTWSPKTDAFVNNDEHVSSYFSDADSLTYSVVQQPYGFKASIVSGDVLHLSGTPVTPYTNLVVRATDPGGLYADLTYGLNYAPYGYSGAVAAYSPTSGSFAIPTVDVRGYFYDADGDVVSYAISETPGGAMSAMLSGNVLLLSGTPTVGTTFKIRATDVHGAYDDATVAVDYMPQAVVRPAVTPTGAVTQIDLNEYFSDADGEALAFELGNLSPAPSVYASLSGHMLLLSGVATVPYVEPVYATDYRSGWVSASVSVQATAGIPQALPSGGLTYVTWSPKTDAFVNNDEHVSSYFSDTDALTYSVVLQPYGFEASIVSGDVLHLSGTPVTPYTNMVVRATDPGGLYADLTYGLNYAPLGYSGVVAAYSPTSGSFAMPTVDVRGYFYDTEGDVASYTMIEPPGGAMSATLSGNVLLLSGTPTVGTTFKIRATDTHGAYDDATVAVDYMPQAVVRPAVTPTGAVTQIDLNEYFSDAEGDPLQFIITYYDGRANGDTWGLVNGNSFNTGNVWGSVSGNILTISDYNADQLYIGIEATDGHGIYTPNTVSITYGVAMEPIIYSKKFI